MAQQNNNPARLFASQFLYQLFLKENQDFKQRFESHSLDSEELKEKVNLFKSTYTDPDQEHPASNISAAQLIVAEEVIYSLYTNYQNISSLLEGSVKSSPENLTPVDRSILLVGITEIIHQETPFQIVANEMVTISKAYGTETSGKFINGVLDGIGKSHTP